MRLPGMGFDQSQAIARLREQFPQSSEQNLAIEAQRMIAQRQLMRQKAMSGLLGQGVEPTSEVPGMKHGGRVYKTADMMKKIPGRAEGGRVSGIRPNLHGMRDDGHRVGSAAGAKGSRGVPTSERGRSMRNITGSAPTGLDEFYQNRENLNLENSARAAVDPVSGLPQTPTQQEMDAQIAMLAQKPAEFPGMGGVEQAALMKAYFDAKRSGNPSQMEAATGAVQNFKNQLNALRAQKVRQQGGQPYKVNEAGPESFKPEGGGAPQPIEGGEQVVGFPQDGTVLPAGRTAQLASQGQLSPQSFVSSVAQGGLPERSMASSTANVPAVPAAPTGRTANLMASGEDVDLGTGKVYDMGGGKRKLFSQYGEGSSVVPPRVIPIPSSEQLMADTMDSPQGLLDAVGNVSTGFEGESPYDFSQGSDLSPELDANKAAAADAFRTLGRPTRLQSILSKGREMKEAYVDPVTKTAEALNPSNWGATGRTLAAMLARYLGSRP